jgi:hypothetical protein
VKLWKGFPLSLDQATCWETIDNFDDGQASMYNDIGEAHQEQKQPAAISRRSQLTHQSKELTSNKVNLNWN